MRSVLTALAALLAACAPAEDGPPRAHDVGTSERAIRPTDTGVPQQWRYQPTDVVEQFDSPDGGFRVHFTRAGVNAVPPADAQDSGVPDMVRAVAGIYDDVGSVYDRAWGFRRPLGDGALPDNGGDGRFDVYLLDFGTSADGTFRVDQCTAANPEQCIGYILQENDFAGFGYPSIAVATTILGSHEYFHAVQDAYDDGQGVVIAEGTAVWATETYAPQTNDFEGFIGGYLSQVDRSLDSPPAGPVPSFAYGSAIFFQFLSERYERALIRKLWEHLENGHGLASEPANLADPYWMVQLDALLKADYQSSFAQAYREFATWNLYLGSAANPARSYANGARYPQPKLTAVTAPYQALPLRVYYASTQYYRAPAAGRAAMTAALVNDPATPEDDTAGLSLVLATRRAGVNAEVVTLASATAGVQALDTSGATDLIVGVVNGDREQYSAASLSRKPGLCIGTAAEVQACLAALGPPAADGGTDAGVCAPASCAQQGTDCGTVYDGCGGTLDCGSCAAPLSCGVGGRPNVCAPPATQPPPPCGCGMGPSGGALLLLPVLLLAVRKRRAKRP